MAQVVVRPLTTGDAPAVAELCGQLGYPGTAEQLAQRIQRSNHSEDRSIFGALLYGEFAGWIDATVERHLQSEDIVVIGGLVVRESVRGRGLGKRLCEAVEQWARERGFQRVRVRSQIKRDDAHRFYLQNQYRQVKTSLVFEKNLE